MALPSVQGYLLGTRQPLDYVGMAIDAFSQVSSEFRQTRAMNLAEQQEARQAGQQQFENQLKSREFEEQMFNVGLAREDALLDRQLKIDDQEMQREMHASSLQTMAMNRALGLDTLKNHRPLQRKYMQSQMDLNNSNIKAREAELGFLRDMTGTALLGSAGATSAAQGGPTGEGNLANEMGGAARARSFTGGYSIDSNLPEGFFHSAKDPEGHAYIDGRGRRWVNLGAPPPGMGDVVFPGDPRAEGPPEPYAMMSIGQVPSRVLQNGSMQEISDYVNTFSTPPLSFQDQAAADQVINGANLNQQTIDTFGATVPTSVRRILAMNQLRLTRNPAYIMANERNGHNFTPHQQAQKMGQMEQFYRQRASAHGLTEAEQNNHLMSMPKGWLAGMMGMDDTDWQKTIDDSITTRVDRLEDGGGFGFAIDEVTSLGFLSELRAAENAVVENDLLIEQYEAALESIPEDLRPHRGTQIETELAAARAKKIAAEQEVERLKRNRAAAFRRRGIPNPFTGDPTGTGTTQPGPMINIGTGQGTMTVPVAPPATGASGLGTNRSGVNTRGGASYFR